jgi:type VI secretion system protein ImpL
MLHEMQKFYFADYIQAWFNFLKSAYVTQFGSFDDAVAQITLLAARNGPLVELLHVTAKNLQIVKGNNSAKTLQHFIAGNFTQQKPLEIYLKELTLLTAELQRLTGSQNQDRDAQQFAMQILSGIGNNTELYKSTLLIKSVLMGVDDFAVKEVLQSIFLQPIRESWRVILQQATHNLEDQWQTQIYNVYLQTIAGKFPFTNHSSEDAAVTDVANFLQPRNGILWNFVNNNLSPYVVENGGEWREQQWLGIGANFSPQFLQALTQAKFLAENLFKTTNGQPGFNYQLYPEPTPNLSEIVLTTQGQTLRYVNGPQQWQSMNWPGPESDATSELTAIAATGLSPNTLEASGPWGIFRLLSEAELSLDADVFRATWNMHTANRNYNVTLLLRNSNHINVFEQILFHPFILPNTIFSQ